MKAQAKTERLVQLDILRGIAILLVLGCHFAFFVTPKLNPGRLQGLSQWFERFGWAGVDLFFVLSGFLVGGLLFHELRTRRSLDVRRFMIRRGFKIWPLYYAYLAVMMLRHTITHDFSFVSALQTWWPNLLHIQNYYSWAPRRYLWSLAVEEHFYLALPLLLWLATTRRRSATTAPKTLLPFITSVPRLAFTIMTLCLLGRWWGFLYAPAMEQGSELKNVWWIYSATHMRVDSLVFGVLLAYWHHYEPWRLAFATRRAGLLLLASLVLIAPMMFLSRNDGPFVSVAGYSMLYLGFGAMLLAFTYTPLDSKTVLARVLGSAFARTLAYIGLFSYPIYLWHFDSATQILVVLAKKGLLAGLPPEARWMLLAAAHLALATACGIFWSWLLERPSLALRDRLFPRRANALSVSDVGHSDAAQALSAEPSPAELHTSTDAATATGRPGLTVVP